MYKEAIFSYKNCKKYLSDICFKHKILFSESLKKIYDIEKIKNENKSNKIVQEYIKNYGKDPNMKNKKHKIYNFIAKKLTNLNFNENKYGFDEEIKTTSIKNYKKLFKLNNLTYLLLLKIISNLLKNNYKITFTNRNDIIENIHNFLEEKISPYYITVLDIKSFYETIKKDKILEKIKINKFLSDKYFEIFEKILNKIDTPFIPRGFSISPILSEIYMKDFDRKMKLDTNIFYYARYVDDIIIFSYKEINIKEIENLLPDGLSFNNKKNKVNIEITTPVKNNNKDIDKQIRENKKIKTKIDKLENKLKSSTQSNNNKHFIEQKIKYLNLILKNQIEQNKFEKEFEFLGYKFVISKTNDINIKMSDKKVKKIKSRIMLALMAFLKNKNFKMLKERIHFLTTNYRVKGNLYAGIYYNNIMLNNPDNLDPKINSLKELDIFLFKNIFQKTICNQENILTKNQRNELKTNYSFVRGFFGKIFNDVSSSEIKSIKKCWREK